ncbi:hypothetical protein C942_04732 [Photobacterium marinum]|uniref:Uncharacterized protein n=1 Tax=Photobacterium marinum TaxID=1056511 RepID=L8J2V7_9GAMM|nr:hypothetical protein C942_04732 [Photobacterium marinum]
MVGGQQTGLKHLMLPHVMATVTMDMVHGLVSWMSRAIQACTKTYRI